jgi:hypothetical protein
MSHAILMSGNEARFCSKTHIAEGKAILAVCDTGLLGRTIKFRYVDFNVSDSFYGGGRSDGKKILQKVRKADMVNVVGKGIVDLLVRNGMVDRECVLWMGDVPHVQIIRI